MLDRFVRASELPAALGVSKRLIAYWRARGEFPHPRRVGEKMVAWLESEIADWMRGLKSNRPKMYAKENLATLTV
jgi:predicted DNA-binding transcriptional regulator AlpA